MYLFGAQSLPHPHQDLLRVHGLPFTVIPDAGHGMMGENPRAVAQAVADTLP
jgi:pimeloyl-ACP methyl ester carboxylesterase